MSLLVDMHGTGKVDEKKLEKALPEIFLGYGTRDRYARTSELLAQRLPAARVSTVAGGHDWPTWIKLWKIMLVQAFAK